MNLKELRLNAGFATQVALAEDIGTNRVNVNRWEKGERTPDIVTIQKLSKLFNVSEGDVITAITNSKNDTA